MSIQQFKPILFADEAVSKTPFSKKGKQSLYFTTSLTTLLLLQACAGSGNGDLDGSPQGGDQNGGNQNGGEQNGGNQNGGDDGRDDSPAEVQPPSASDIVKILTGALGEDADGADYGEIVYNARANGNYTSNAGDDVLVMWQEGNVGDEISSGRGNDVVRTFIGNRSVHGNDGDDVIFSGFNDDKILISYNLLAIPRFTTQGQVKGKSSSHLKG